MRLALHVIVLVMSYQVICVAAIPKSAGAALTLAAPGNTADIVYESLVLVRKLKALKTRVQSMMNQIRIAFSEAAENSSGFDFSEIKNHIGDFDVLAYFASLEASLTALDDDITKAQHSVGTVCKQVASSIEAACYNDSAYLFDEGLCSQKDVAFNEYQASVRQSCSVVHSNTERLCNQRMQALGEFAKMLADNVEAIDSDTKDSIAQQCFVRARHDALQADFMSTLHTCTSAYGEALRQHWAELEQEDSALADAIWHKMRGLMHDTAYQANVISQALQERTDQWLADTTQNCEINAGSLRVSTQAYMKACIDAIEDQYRHLLDECDTRVNNASYETDVLQLKLLIDKQLACVRQAYSGMCIDTAEQVKNKLIRCTNDVTKVSQDCVDEIGKNGTILARASQEQLHQFMLNADAIQAKIRAIVGCFQNEFAIKISNAIALHRMSYSTLEEQLKRLQYDFIEYSSQRAAALLEGVQQLDGQQIANLESDYNKALLALDDCFNSISKSLQESSADFNMLASQYEASFVTIVTEDVANINESTARTAKSINVLIDEMQANALQASQGLFSELECLSKRQQAEICEKFSTAQKEMIAAVDEMLIALEHVKGLISESILAGEENLINVIGQGVKGGISVAGLIIKYLVHTYEALYVSIFKIFEILAIPF